MKKILLSLALVGLLLFALSWTANAVDPVTPTVAGVEPTSAFNDIDARVTITGGSFLAGVDGTATVSLGSTPLTDVTWVDTQTLTATVPWGMDPRAYDLTVTNPGGGTVTLSNAFTVARGIGQWNSGKLFGGWVSQVLLKPGDPTTLYALAFKIGLFRSTDAGESWKLVDPYVQGNATFAIDPLHPEWVYSYAGGDHEGLSVSKDEGDTWTMLFKTWPGGGQSDVGQAYPSPNDSQTVFVSSGHPVKGGTKGLIRSTDGGAHWIAVPSMVGTPVADVAFDPTDASKMVLATEDGRVFQSIDRGVSWAEVAKPPLSSIWHVAYNSYRSGEVWVSAPTGFPYLFKSTDASLSTWQNRSPNDGSRGAGAIRFASADSIYIGNHHTIDGGQNWDWFGPQTGTTEMCFDPASPLVGYMGDQTQGVRKTTDGGTIWNVKNQGLTGMDCVSMEVSRADPLRVFAVFNAWSGIHRSDDGTNDWTYLPIADSYNMRQVREDPFDSQHLYATADTGLYVSPNAGATWTPLGWNLSPASPPGMFAELAVDPHRPGHLLVADRIFGSDPLHGTDTGVLYSSDDSGASWQLVALPTAPLQPIKSIAFDPETTGTVYLAAATDGVYKSTNCIARGGTWTRLDQLPLGVASAESVAIATHPAHRLVVGSNGGMIWRSSDAGATWASGYIQLGGVQDNSGSNALLFANADSTRLYAPEWDGLLFSPDAGVTWTRAAGALGRLHTTAVGAAMDGTRTIVYAATIGGDAGSAGSSSIAASGRSSTALGARPAALAAAGNLVGAGIYRYAQVQVQPTSITIKPATTSTYIGRTVRLSGLVTPQTMIGVNIVVYVMKPGKTYWTYSSNRTVYTYAGSPASWMYPYYFKPGMARGYYKFKARTPAPGFASSAGFATSESPIISIRVR